jgi:hypothetical protein
MFLMLLPNGVVSVLITFTKVSPPDAGVGAAIPGSRMDLTQPTLDGMTAPQDGAAIHCGTPMQLVTPAVGWESASYTFAPADCGGTELLPPVWRCGCGFQLDAWSAGTRPGHASIASGA